MMGYLSKYFGLWRAQVNSENGLVGYFDTIDKAIAWCNLHKVAGIRIDLDDWKISETKNAVSDASRRVQASSREISSTGYNN